YTKMLLDAMPRVDNPDRKGHASPAPTAKPEVLLNVNDLKVYFPVRGKGLFGKTKPLRAVDGVSFALHQGETLGIVGESGCGTPTLGLSVLTLLPKADGTVVWMTRDLSQISDSDQRRLRKELQ